MIVEIFVAYGGEWAPEFDREPWLSVECDSARFNGDELWITRPGVPDDSVYCLMDRRAHVGIDDQTESWPAHLVEVRFR